MRQPLWATVAGLVGSLQPRHEAAETLRVRAVTLDLPLEIAVLRSDAGVELLGNPPRWRLRTAFDPPPARLVLSLQPERLPELPGVEVSP